MKIKNILGLVLVTVFAMAAASCANQNKKLSLKRVHFDFDRSYVRSDMAPVMDDNVAFLRKGRRHFSTKAINKGFSGNLAIEGHCDNRGTNEYNYALGARRAESAKSYFVSHGIDSSRLQTVSYGEDRPLCRESNEACWYMNRRAEFKVDKK